MSAGEAHLLGTVEPQPLSVVLVRDLAKPVARPASLSPKTAKNLGSLYACARGRELRGTYQHACIKAD
eukprot:3811229-Pleurochrysis_carterae.AAC.1